MDKEETDVPVFPIKQDITFLKPNPKNLKKLNFLFAEGDVVLKDKNLFMPCVEENFEFFEDVVVDGISTKLDKNRLRNFEDIKEGEVVFSTWYDGEVVAMTVEDIDEDRHTANGRIDDSCYGNLHFNDDFRGCWRCGGYVMINDYAKAKLEVV